jgi:hypothetical protein
VAGRGCGSEGAFFVPSGSEEVGFVLRCAGPGTRVGFKGWYVAAFDLFVQQLVRESPPLLTALAQLLEFVPRPLSALDRVGQYYRSRRSLL